MSSIVKVKCVDPDYGLIKGYVYEGVVWNTGYRILLNGKEQWFRGDRFIVEGEEESPITVRDTRFQNQPEEKDEEQRLRKILIKPVHKENCPSCNAPLPCDFH